MMAHRELVLADQHVVDAEGRITRQLLLIKRMAAAGRDTIEAEVLLQLLKQSLTVMHRYHRLILAEVITGEPPG
jgi:hypothetical protein